MLCGAALMLALSSALPHGVARAHGPPAPALNWVRLPGAERCIAAAELADRIEERVGRVLFVPDTEAGLSVDGRVGRNEQGFQVTLQVSKPGGRVLGEREIEVMGDDCAAIEEAVVLVIAVTLYPRTGLLGSGIPLDPETAAGLEALFGDEPLDPDPEALPQADPEPEPAPVRRVSRPAPTPAGFSGAETTVELDAAGAVAAGQLPGLSFGVAARLGLRFGALWPIELGAALWHETVEERAGGQARFGLIAGSVALCPWQVPVRGRLCLGARAGSLRVEATGFAETEPASTDLVVDLEATGLFRPRLWGALHAYLGLSLALPLLQHGYTFQAADGTTVELFRIAQLTIRAQIGLGLSI